MENETQNTRGVPNVGSRSDIVSTPFDVVQPAQLQTPSAPVASAPSPELSNFQPQPATAATPASPPREGQRLWLSRKTVLITVGLIALVGGVLLALRIFSPGTFGVNSQQSSLTASEFSPLDIPLGEIAQSGQLSFDSSRTLNINGQLKANSSFVISPSDKPASGIAGQMYYDRTTNELNYYNGTGFVSLTNNPQTVVSINGTGGTFTLGGGLSLNGTQLSNSGVVSVTSASSTLTVANDGNGNVTIGSSADAAVSGTIGTIAVFSGVNKLSSSIISQTSATSVDINGGLSMSGTLNIKGGDVSTINIGSTTNSVVGQLYNDGNLHITGGSNNLWLDAGGSGTIFMNAANGNRVAINEATIPSYALEVNGDINITAGHSYRIDGTIVCSIGGCTGGGGGGSGVSSLDTLTGDLTIDNTTAAGTTLTIDDASTSQKGIAQFNSTNFSVSSGVVNTVQNISTSAAPTFGQLSLVSSQVSATMLTVNNTNALATGNLVDLQVSGTTEFSVGPAGDLFVNGTINGQTISSSASLTGTLGVVGNISTSAGIIANSATITTNINASGTTSTSALSVTNDAGVGGDLNVSGTISGNTITPTGAFTVGDNAIAFTLQGNASSSIKATGGGFTTTVGFNGTATGAVTYNFDRAATPGTYTICTTVGNCAGAGGGVTTPGGTAGTLAKFTAGSTIGDSIITDNGTTVTIGGTLSVNTLTPTSGLVVGSTSQALTLQGNASTTLTATGGGFATSVGFSGTPTGAVSYIFDRAAAAGSYTICTTVGNCAGSGGGVTTSGGTTGTIAVFTGSQSLGDSLLSQSGSTVSATGGFVVRDSATPTKSTRLRNTGSAQDLEAGGSSLIISTWSAADFTGTQYNQVTFHNDGTPIDFSRALNLTAATGQNALVITGAASSPGSLLQLFANGVGTAVMNVDSTGAVVLQNSANSANAFQVKNSSGTQLFNVDTTTSRVTVGSGGSCTTGRLCVGQSTTGSGGGTATNLYNLQSVNVSGTSTIVNQNIVVTDTSSSVANTIRPLIVDTSTSTNTSATINSIYAKTPSGNAGSFLTFDNGASTVFSMTNAGVTTLQNTANSTSALSIRNASGYSVVTVDTTNGKLTLGNVTSTSGQGVAGTVVLADGTNDNFSSTLNTATLTANRTIALPDANGTICLQSSSSCGFAASSGSANYIQNGTSIQTANFAIQSASSSSIAALVKGAVSQSAAIFDVQNSGGTSLFTVGNFNDSTLNTNLTITGQGSSSDVALKVLGNSSQSGAALLADFQQNGGTSVFRVTHEGGIYVGNGPSAIAGTVNLASTSGSFATINTATLSTDRTITLPNASGTVCLDSGNCTSNTLQTAYTFSAGGTTPEIKLDTTRVGIDIQDNDTPLGSNNNFLSLRASNNAGLGAIVFGWGVQGTYFQKPTSDSTTAFQIQNSAGNNLFTIDSTNGRVGVNLGGSANPAYTLEVKGDLNVGTGVYRSGGTAGLTATTCSGGQVLQNQVVTGGIVTGGTCAANSLQTAYNASTNPELVLDATRGALTVRDASSALGANLFEIQNNGGSSTYFAVSASEVASTIPLRVTAASDSTTLLNIKNASGNNLFTVDSTNSRVGIALGSNNTPTLAGSGLEIAGSIRLSGSSYDTYTTPAGASVPSRITIANIDPSNFGQIVAMGLSSTADATTRVLSLFDARTIAHQPSLAVFTPDENNLVGFSWEGSNTNAYLKTTAGNLVLRSGSTDLMTLLSGGNVGIGVSPSYKLDVAGSVNVSSGNSYKIAGTDICTASGCTPSAGSGNYIQNGTSLQTNASINIQSASDSDSTLVIRQRAAQSGDSFRIEDSTGTREFKIDTYGNISQAGRANILGEVGIGDYETSGVQLRVTPSATNSLGIQVVGNSGQTANLLQVDAASLSAALVVDGNGAVSTAGNLTSGAVLAGNSLSVSTTANITGATTVGSLSVNGGANISGTTSTGALSVTNDGNIGGNSNVTGTVTAGAFSGAGLTDCDATNSKLLWDSTTKHFSCGTDRASVTIRKSADESVTSSTTLQNDDELTFSIGANETYIVHITANVTMSSGGAFKYTVAAPTGATCNISALGADGGGTFAEIMNGSCGTTGFYGGAGTSSLEEIDATITTGATSGNVTLQWAQNSSSGTATRVKAGSSLVAYKVSGADLAEAYYTTDNNIGSGDVVALDPSASAGVVKSATPYDNKALGVISTQPGQVLSNPDAGTATGRPVLVALSGRIPVKVSAENGAIHAGDFLTASSTPGVAMKATRPGQVIGRALEGYDNQFGNQGLILMFAGQQWADPRDPSGDQLQTDFLQSANIDNLTAKTASIDNLTVTHNANFLGDVVVHGNTSVMSILVNGHIVTGGDKPIIQNKTCADAAVSVEGTDTTGLITVTTPAGCANSGDIAALTFSRAFDKAPRVTLTPANADASSLQTYVDSDAITPTSFTLATPTAIDGSKTYRWYYQVLQ